MSESPLHGTVFILALGPHSGGPQGEPFVMGYWDGHPDGAGMLEEMPENLELLEAVDWGRARSARVVVRIEDSRYGFPSGANRFWAGDLPVPDDMRSWPEELSFPESDEDS